ncbi:hypothetical protein [Legionella santicrucis]|uniref:hypothetical protein n=1 Tax=Legionella santicrucis TaxID=45074 RepID=UPI00072FA577|nr:hypothetical protein [Legionella santicrucis]
MFTNHKTPLDDKESYRWLKAYRKANIHYESLIQFQTVNLNTKLVTIRCQLSGWNGSLHWSRILHIVSIW